MLYTSSRSCSLVLSNLVLAVIFFPEVHKPVEDDNYVREHGRHQATTRSAISTVPTLRVWVMLLFSGKQNQPNDLRWDSL